MWYMVFSPHLITYIHVIMSEWIRNRCCIQRYTVYCVKEWLNCIIKCIIEGCKALKALSQSEGLATILSPGWPVQLLFSFPPPLFNAHTCTYNFFKLRRPILSDKQKRKEKGSGLVFFSRAVYIYIYIYIYLTEMWWQVVWGGLL